MSERSQTLYIQFTQLIYLAKELSQQQVKSE